MCLYIYCIWDVAYASDTIITLSRINFKSFIGYLIRMTCMGIIISMTVINLYVA